MNTFDLLESRHHVFKYNDEIPPKELVEDALWKAWKTTPSKNNAMPYKVFVYGPEHKSEKVKVWEMVYSNHKDAEIRAVERGQATRTEDGKVNPYYEHIKHNPYLFCIHAEPREPNEFYRRQVELGMFFDQAWPERIDDFIDTTAVEVGMFAQNLSSYLLEKQIDVSYTSCFRREIKYWHQVGLTHSDYRPVMLISAGYCKTYRKDVPYIKNGLPDIKPEHDEMIKWI
ncbi:nitroreductase family protein [Winogradskyella sp.]|uniref:nitroreductase family protein n=1 Tax=Winogradskyella sp. TaxID=1883156 RepID=UPI003F6A40B9